MIRDYGSGQRAAKKGRRPTAHRGHIRHPRVKGMWSPWFVMSSFACYFYLHDRRNDLARQFAQRKYTLIVIRCSSSPSCHGLIAGYDIDVNFSKVPVPGARPFKLICYGLTALSNLQSVTVSITTAFRPHRPFGAVFIVQSLHGRRIDS